MLLALVLILLDVLFLAVLFLGFVQCRKHSFKAGFYFFLILIVHKISAYLYAPLLNTYTNALIKSNSRPPMGMTIGKFVSWLSLLPTIINLIAFGILVVGLYKMWRSKTVPQN